MRPKLMKIFLILSLFSTVALTTNTAALQCMQSQPQKTSTGINFKAWVKLAANATLLAYSCRFIANTFKYNEDDDYSLYSLINAFFKGFIGKQLVCVGTDRVPHQPLIVASGIIFTLSAQQTLSAIKELLYTSNEQNTFDYL